jgi:hypothetical protein
LAAVRNERERRTEDSLPAHGLHCPLGDMATICRSTLSSRAATPPRSSE